jgi:hypothetical protein
MNNANKRMETVVIHHGYDAKEHLGSLSTLVFVFERRKKGTMYIRNTVLVKSSSSNQR